jgi:hypothetical protein
VVVVPVWSAGELVWLEAPVVPVWLEALAPVWLELLPELVSCANVSAVPSSSTVPIRKSFFMECLLKSALACRI